MLTTHGRAGGQGQSWFTTALVVSGLILGVSAGRPANACHITHHKATATTTTEAATAHTPTPASSTPPPTTAELLQASFQKLMAAMPAQTHPTTPTPSVTPAAGTLPVALPQVLTPMPASSTPSVSTWHQTSSSMCTPPPPPPPSTCDSSPTAGSQTMTPPSSSTPPTSPLTNPTAAPEPSTLVIAAGLAGAFAWRRRRNSR